MDELVVAGRLGELVDHRLGDFHPVGDALGADAFGHLLHRDHSQDSGPLPNSALI
jgi:hypothetical protein